MRLALIVSLCVMLFFVNSANAQEVCGEWERKVCGTDVGVCRSGRSICRNGVWEECEGDVGPASEDEICWNGLDDNCDGGVDEGCLTWLSFILVGLGILFVIIGIYYMHKGKGERIVTEGIGKD
ncbi:MAG: hypothetical protein JSV39_03350 [Candidatus Aenigmatarchaeota archaeon]|nr:MAG: hypothetical protein JSV39_03350 [Candidatus Aenigmarchaeota archaeon]